MPIQIGQPTDHGFDEPLGLLSDCHRRIEHFLRVLGIVASDNGGGSLTAEHRRAIEGSLRYFAVAAPKHTADEEDSLFPRLRNSGDPVAVAALSAMDRLERDHDEADLHHAEVDRLFRQWLGADRLSADDTATLRARLARLEALYAQHIAIEDQEVFPAAARSLDPSEIEKIGAEMAARRELRGPST